jgi:hypothetical protein
MKKYLVLLLALVLAASPSWSAPKKSKATVKKAKTTAVESKPKGTAPKLSSKEPKFQGFTNGFLQFGEMEGNRRSFSMELKASPWFLRVSGTVGAGVNTEDLDIMNNDEVVAVLAYYDAPGKTAGGVDYQAAPFDFMIYMDIDNQFQPTVITNLKFSLEGEAAGKTAEKVLKQAQTWNLASGKVWLASAYKDAVFGAQADPLDAD